MPFFRLSKTCQGKKELTEHEYLGKNRIFDGKKTRTLTKRIDLQEKIGY